MPKLFTLAVFFLACLAPVAHAETVTLTEEKLPSGALYHIDGNFDVAASQAQVWEVLTDYSDLKGVVSTMQASCVISRDGNSALVEQVAVGRFLFFSKAVRLLLKVDEQPQNGLIFAQAADKPFKTYNGSWALEDRGNTVTVAYRLNVSSGDMAPPFLERKLFRDNALSLLKELKAEIARRAALPALTNKLNTLTPVIKATAQLR
jgi:ribosome-associated toxin RatA of RatAB toxin-antitoxin module